MFDTHRGSREREIFQIYYQSCLIDTNIEFIEFKAYQFQQITEKLKVRRGVVFKTALRTSNDILWTLKNYEFINDVLQDVIMFFKRKILL